jgi:hypothetical protein
VIDASTASDMVRALAYYASPATYKNIRVMADPPCGDFRFDFEGIDEYGHLARTALAHVCERLGIEAPRMDEPDHALMERIGIDVAARYAPPPPPEQDPDYDPQMAGAPCCGIRRAFIDGQLDLGGLLPDACPLCGAPDKPDSILAEEGESRAYICGLTLHACGHYMFGGFVSMGEQCLLVLDLKARAEGREGPNDIAARFIEQYNLGTDAYGRVGARFDEHGQLQLKVHVRAGHELPQLPDRFADLPVQVELLSR